MVLSVQDYCYLLLCWRYFYLELDEDDPGDGSNDCTDLAPDTVESTDDSNDTTHVEVSTVS